MCVCVHACACLSVCMCDVVSDVLLSCGLGNVHQRDFNSTNLGVERTQWKHSDESVYLLRTFHINGNMQYVAFASVLFFTQHNDFEVYPSCCMCQVTQCNLWLGDEMASLLVACTGPRCDIDKSHILRSGHWTRSSGFNINWGSVQIDILTPVIPIFHSTHIHYPSSHLLLWVSWKYMETKVKKHGLS